MTTKQNRPSLKQDVEVNMSPCSLSITYGDAVDAANALMFMSEQLNSPDFDTDVKIAECRRALKPLVDDFTAWQNKVALEYAVRDESGEIVRNENSGFQVRVTEYNVAIAAEKIKTRDIAIPLWTYDELRWLRNQRVGKSKENPDGQPVTSGVLTALQPLIVK